MAPTNSEARRIQKREAEKRRRDRIRNDPVLLAAQQEKERRKYQRKKETGKIKLVADMTSREHRYRKKEWNKWNARRLANIQKALELDQFEEADHTDPTPGPSKRRSEHLKEGLI